MSSCKLTETQRIVEVENALHASGTVPILLQESGELNVLTTQTPDWLKAVGPLNLDTFYILECVLPDFEPCWEDGDEVEVFGPWEQESSLGPLALEIKPANSPLGKVLLLTNLGADHAERVEILQKARDNLLVHEALEREIKKKEFLLHTIVHDLAGPLTSMKGALHILQRPGLPEDSVQELLQIGLRQAERQDVLIREILEVFAAEVESLDERNIETTTDPLRVGMLVVQSLKAAFQAKGVRLSATGDSGQVVGSDSKLERVISNLVENALRNVPEGGQVVVSSLDRGDSVLIEISDDGPGVPEEAAGRLFQKMAKGKKGGGKIGLGLYFCKLTVQSWGGEIGYKPAELGGACFWFELPKKQVPTITPTES